MNGKFEITGIRKERVTIEVDKYDALELIRNAFGLAYLKNYGDDFVSLDRDKNGKEGVYSVKRDIDGKYKKTFVTDDEKTVKALKAYNMLLELWCDEQT